MKNKIWYVLYPVFWIGYPISLTYACSNKMAFYIAIVFTVILISCIIYVITGILNHPREFIEEFSSDDETFIGGGF